MRTGKDYRGVTAKNFGKVAEKNAKLSKNMSLRETMEFSKTLSVSEGGAEVIIEKIVDEIEDLKRCLRNSS